MKPGKSGLTVVTDALRHEGGLFSLVRKTVRVLWQEGVKGIVLRVHHLLIVRAQRSYQPASVEPQEITYEEWIRRNESEPDDATLAKWHDRLPYKPVISIVMPIYDPDPEHLRAAINSVRSQAYPHWELCLVDDGSPVDQVTKLVDDFGDTRIRLVRLPQNQNISAASNAGIELATGDFLGFLDHDDVLAPLALFFVALEINRYPDLGLVYSDEDKLDDEGCRSEPHFKPDWNHPYALSCNYLCHFSVYRRKLVTALGGCRRGLEGAQDYDLALRVIEGLDPGQIRHIPRVLYHWRRHAGSTAGSVIAKPYALDAGLRAVREHLKRAGLKAEASADFIRNHVRFSTNELPPVTFVIPTRDRIELLQLCIDGLLNHTDYPDIRILVVDNESTCPDTLQYLDALQGKPSVDVLRQPGKFNFAALNNLAVAQVNTEYLCLLNNDVEVIHPDWLRNMMALLQQPDVGIVGAKLLFDDGTVQHGGVLLGIGGVAGHAHKYFADDDPGYFGRNVASQELSAVTAACLLTRKSTFEEVGGMDADELAIAFNDIDFCLKVGQTGRKVIWTPLARLYHHESKSRGQEDTLDKVSRFNAEIEVMQKRWGELLLADPAYNPNLSLTHEDFRLAPVSRAPSVEDLLDQLAS